MGNERIDEDPIQMQPVLSVKPDAVAREVPGGLSVPWEQDAAVGNELRVNSPLEE